MNITERKTRAYEAALAATGLAEVGIQIDTRSYVVEVEVEGEAFYVEFKGVVKSTKGTKETENRAARPGFDLEVAVAAYEAKRAAKEAEKAAKEAAKAAKEAENED